MNEADNLNEANTVNENRQKKNVRITALILAVIAIGFYVAAFLLVGGR